MSERNSRLLLPTIRVAPLLPHFLIPARDLVLQTPPPTLKWSVRRTRRKAPLTHWRERHHRSVRPCQRRLWAVMHRWSVGLRLAAWLVSWSLQSRQLLVRARVRPCRRRLQRLSSTVPTFGPTLPPASRLSSASCCWRESWTWRSRQPPLSGPPSRGRVGAKGGAGRQGGRARRGCR